MSSSYDSYSSKCFDPALYPSWFIAQYACTTVFTVVYLAIFIGLFVIRRRLEQGKHLIGLPYILAVFFMTVSKLIAFVRTTIQGCPVNYDPFAVYKLDIALIVFEGIQTILLLFVVIYTLNTMLRKELGHRPTAIKIVLGVDLFVLGSLLITQVVMNSYVSYWTTESFRGYYKSIGFGPMTVVYIGLAFNCLYLMSMLGSGVLALLAARSLKKQRVAQNSLIVWISVLFFSLIVFSLLGIITVSIPLGGSLYFGAEGYVAIYWISSLAQAVALIAVIIIARNSVWGSNAAAKFHTTQHQHPYNP